jgi:hypothetical protein
MNKRLSLFSKTKKLSENPFVLFISKSLRVKIVSEDFAKEYESFP